jgi:hypothetical protein
MLFQFWEERATSKIGTPPPVTPTLCPLARIPCAGSRGVATTPGQGGLGRSEEPQATGSRWGGTVAAGTGSVLDSCLRGNDRG